MTGKADRRRPLILLSGLIAVVGAALVAPVLIGARQGEPIPGSTVRAQSRDSVAITAPVALFADPRVTMERGTVSLAANDEDAGFGAVVRALVNGSGVDLMIDEAAFTVDRSARTGTNESPQPANTLTESVRAVVSALSEFKFGSLRLADASVAVLTQDGRQETFSRIDADLTTDRNGVVTAKGRLAFRGEPLQFDIAFAPQPADAIEPVKVRADVKGDYIALSFNGGRMPPGDRGRIVAETAELTISDVRKAANWLGADWSSGPGLGSFSAKGTLVLDERSISFADANMTLDGNAASGMLALTFASKRPVIEGTLAFATFDLAPYSTAAPSTAIARATGWLSGIGIPGLAGSSILNELDADLRVSAANITKGGERLGRAAASLTVTGGKLLGEIAELAFEQGGTGEGQFTADVTGADPSYTVRADLNDIDFAMLPVPDEGPPVLEGVGTLKMDLTASGASESGLLRSLAGNLSVEMREGSRLGVNLDALPAAVDTPQHGWGNAASGGTALTGLSARFSAVGGVLTADGVEARLGSRTARVIGSIDIDGPAIDFVVSIDESPGAAQSSGKPVGAFRVQGPWTAPQIRSAEPGRAADGRQAKGERDPG